MTPSRHRGDRSVILADMNLMPRLLAKKTLEPMTDTDPFPSEAHRLAAAVRRPGRHQLEEHKLSGLRDKGAELRQRLIALRVEANPTNAHQIDKDIAEVVQAMATNDAELRRCRLELAPMRAEHAAKVERELRPMRQAAAQRVNAAAAELRAALSEINAVHDAGRLHGADWPSVHVDGLDRLDDQLRGII